MKTNNMWKLALAVVAMVLFSGIGVSAQSKTDCATKTDEEIVKEIYAKIATKYDDQIIHINVRSKAGVVTLEGWGTTKKVVKDIEKMAKKLKCVKKVDNKLTVGIGGGCGPGLKKCGAICIPQEETCNICTTRTCN